MNDSFHDGELDSRYYDISDRYEESQKALKEIKDMANDVLNNLSGGGYTPEHMAKVLVNLVGFLCDVTAICEKELGESR